MPNQTNPLTWPRLESDTTDSFFIFNPLRIMDTFPTSFAPSLSPEAARTRAVLFANTIVVSQEHPPDFGGPDLISDRSQAFGIYPISARPYFETSIQWRQKLPDQSPSYPPPLTTTPSAYPPEATGKKPSLSFDLSEATEALHVLHCKTVDQAFFIGLGLGVAGGLLLAVIASLLWTLLVKRFFMKTDGRSLRAWIWAELPHCMQSRLRAVHQFWIDRNLPGTPMLVARRVRRQHRRDEEERRRKDPPGDQESLLMSGGRGGILILPDDESVAGNENAPGNENVPDQVNIPGQEKVQGQENVPGQEILPGQEIVPDNENALGEKSVLVPENVVNPEILPDNGNAPSDGKSEHYSESVISENYTHQRQGGGPWCGDEGPGRISGSISLHYSPAYPSTPKRHSGGSNLTSHSGVIDVAGARTDEAPPRQRRGSFESRPEDDEDARRRYMEIPRAPTLDGLWRTCMEGFGVGMTLPGSAGTPLYDFTGALSTRRESHHESEQRGERSGGSQAPLVAGASAMPTGGSSGHGAEGASGDNEARDQQAPEDSEGHDDDEVSKNAWRLLFGDG
ncbi:hypothetical protein F5X98DRAFT_377710 [Xylaria grammica]|nr:hypothetical protein F5X98DRAFT_377710 [Xylaria grammica]